MKVLIAYFSLTGNTANLRSSGSLRYLGNPTVDARTNSFVAGATRPVIHKRYPLSEVPKVLRYLENGHARGKADITL
jgi:NADPH:quinone reductase-like Zn-dependent oxidoreductase